MRMRSKPPGCIQIVVGSAIVLLGLLLLLGSLFDLNLGALWPLFVALPGLIILIAGLASADGGGGTAATVIGSQLSALGVLLLFQNLTGLWQTWSYAWALVWPTSIGAGLVARGSLSGNHRMTRSGINTATVGFVIFILGFAFFEGILNISGSSLGVLGDLALPAVLIGIGLVVILRRR